MNVKQGVVPTGKVSGMQAVLNAIHITPRLIFDPMPAYAQKYLPFAMAASMEATPGGRLWTCWAGGEDGPNAYLLASYSDDRGRSWRDPVFVIDPQVHGRDMGTRLGAFWCDPQGRLWLFFHQSVGMFDGSCSNWFVRCDSPDAEKPVWTEPVYIGFGASLNKPIVRGNGEWILPVSLWERWHIDEPFADCYHELDAVRGANVFVSDDEGDHWRYRGGIIFEDSCFNEHSVVELRDGRLWMLSRGMKAAVQSFSGDGGMTWEPQSVAFPHVNSKCIIRRLQSGAVLLIRHGQDMLHSTADRRELTAFLSDDDGRTWSSGFLLDERDGVSYPDIAQGPDGDIYVHYDRDRTGDAEILFAHFREEDVQAGKLISAGATLKNPVKSKLGMHRGRSGNGRHLFSAITRALDALVAAAQPSDGLIPSLLDRSTGAMLTVLPPAIPGQRDWDRAHLGSNLIHDEATLKTLYALANALGRLDYAAAADRYLQCFATHCTDTATGLFPWGEHSFWHLTEDRVGNSYALTSERPMTDSAIHDHLRQTPLWLWEKLWQFNPRCVERFAEGLDFHWQEGKREEYIRHANIEQRTHQTPYARSCDFPRHSGFYILDWAYAWQQTGRAEFLDQIRTMLDYWWGKRDDRGLLLIESRSPSEDTRFHNINAPGQTISLATSLLETADLLAAQAPELATVMRERAAVYIDGFFAAPHDLEKGVYVISSRRDDNTVTEAMPVWGSVYGVWPASYVALTCLCAYRMTSDARLLEWAEAVGRDYRSQPFPADAAIPAMDAGLGLGLLADLFDITDDTAWIEGAVALAERLVSVYFDEAPLPRGAAGIDWYESQMGPGFLLHGLARTALLASDRAHCPLGADYTAR